MSELYTDIDVNENGINIIHAQDVEPIKEECYRQLLHRNQQGRQGLGVKTCSIPVVEIQKAKAQGIDLMDKKQRERWLITHPEYRVYQNTGRSGKIIIK